MQTPQIWLPFVVALIPLLIGMLWYSPVLFVNAWLNASGVDPSPPSRKQMIKTFALTYLFSLLFTGALISNVIHQTHLFSLMQGESTAALLKDSNSIPSQELKHFIETYGTEFRTFKHGAFHGFLTGLFISLAFIGVTALFEKRNAKYILIHVGYWTICSCLMGGLLSAFF